MTEEVLQHIWQYQIFKDEHFNSLKTVDGKFLKIIKVGNKNFNQGPDFSDGKIIIDDIEWNGNIEIHLKSSLWNVHKHQNDPNYDNVILHVVLVDDKPVYRPNGERIPCVELKSIVKEDWLKKYDDFIESETIIPCENYLEKVSSIAKRSMLERVLIERLERKSKLFNDWLVENNGDWEQTTFEVVSYCLGLKINSLQFRNLANKVSYKIISKHQDNLLQIQSLLFGVAGFLDEDSISSYQGKLKTEFKFLSHKYNFKACLKKQDWNFHRLRPASFPTLRIGELASFLNQNEFLFSKIKEIKTIQELKKVFDAKMDDYWSIHYNFGKETKTQSNKIGGSKIESLIINGVVPLLYLFFKKTGDEELFNRCFYFLESLKKESNSKLDKVNHLFQTKSSYDSQSILELIDYYCKEKKCLSCSICNSIL